MTLPTTTSWKEDIHLLHSRFYSSREGKILDPISGRMMKPKGECRLCGTPVTKNSKAPRLRMTCIPCARKEK